MGYPTVRRCFKVIGYNTQPAYGQYWGLDAIGDIFGPAEETTDIHYVWPIIYASED